MKLLEGRPSSGVAAGMAVLLIAGATVAGSALAYHGRSGTATTPPGASARPGASAGAGGSAARPSQTAAPGSTATATATPSASPSPSATASPRATTAATTAPSTPPPACAAGNLTLTTTTDQPTYPIGAAVRITTSMRNSSTRTCTTDGQTGCGPGFTVFDSGGAAVWTSVPPGTVRNCPAAFASPLAPGQSVSFSTTWDQCTWQNQKCTGQVQRGAYSAAGAWSEGGATAARFSIA